MTTTVARGDPPASSAPFVRLPTARVVLVCVRAPPATLQAARRYNLSDAVATKGTSAYADELF